MIRVKDIETLRSLLVHPAHPRLMELVGWFCGHYPDTIITCGYEMRDYPSVHSVIPLRGLDVRSRGYADPGDVADQVNKQWIYDPARPERLCAIYHDTGRGKHIHLQVHDRTQKVR